MRRRNKVYDRYGNEIDDHGDVLKDGERLRVPLTMLDSDRRAMAEAARRALSGGSDAITTDSPAVVTDGFGCSDIAAMSRPGSRHLHHGTRGVDNAIAVTREHMRREAYTDSKQQLADAWKTGANDREISDVPVVTGDAREDARLAMIRDAENAWRGPKSSGKW